MKIVKCLLASCLFLSVSAINAEEAVTQTPNINHKPAYIADDLFIYMHTGPGNNYRMQGTINAGEKVVITGDKKNDYSQIIDTRGRSTWVESKYISTTPGLKIVITELNEKLANFKKSDHNLSTELTHANDEIAQLNEKNKQLKSELSSLNKNLVSTTSKLSTQDLEIKKEYFFNGAIVLIIGLLFGLVLPRFLIRKKASMDNWK